MKVLVVAGTHAEYVDWLRANNFNPTEYVYVYSEHQLWGKHGAKIIKVGRWWLNPLTEKGQWFQQIERGEVL